MTRKTKNILKTILFSLLGLAVIVGVASLFVNKADEDGYEKVSLSYTIGALDNNGKPIENKQSMYSNVIDDFEEIKFTLDFDNDIKYQLYYYDGNDEFISHGEVFTKNTVHTSIDGSERVRVVITVVTDDKDFELNFFNKYSYSSQLTVEVKPIVEKEIHSFVLENLTDGADYTIEYEEGMTWREWLESEYNTYVSCFQIGDDDNLAFNVDEYYYLFEYTANNSPVKVDDVISSNIKRVL